MNNNRLEAVLELGSFRLFTPDTIEFLQQSMKGIAITLADIHSRQLVNNLLEQAQAQSEELRGLQDGYIGYEAGSKTFTGRNT